MIRTSLRVWAVVTTALTLIALDTSAHADPKTIDVVIEHFKFIPDSIEAAPGDIVVFSNHDIVPHTATAADGSWTTKDIAKGQSESIVVPASGAPGYFCRYHPVMKGQLTIKN